MSGISQADEYLIEQIRLGSQDAWSTMINRYEGRLLAFAGARVKQRADAEDLVQESFISFIGSINQFRGQGSIENYLFSILRRKIIDNFRTPKNKHISLIQDIYTKSSLETDSDAFANLPSSDPTASWYVRKDEAGSLQRKALAGAIAQLSGELKDSLNFLHLQIIELLFYCRISNSDVAAITNQTRENIAVIKHRYLKQLSDSVRSQINQNHSTDSIDQLENILTEIWQENRFTCPKRNTIGAYMLNTLEPLWHQYVDFHINKLGCHFCLANLEDLRSQNTEKGKHVLQNRIMESTIGFLKK